MQRTFVPYYQPAGTLGLPSGSGWLVATLPGFRCYIQAPRLLASTWYRLRTRYPMAPIPAIASGHMTLKKPDCLLARF